MQVRTSLKVKTYQDYCDDIQADFHHVHPVGRNIVMISVGNAVNEMHRTVGKKNTYQATQRTKLSFMSAYLLSTVT